MNVGCEGSIKAHSSAELTYDSHKRKEIFACRAEGNILRLHSGQGNLSL